MCSETARNMSISAGEVSPQLRRLCGAGTSAAAARIRGHCTTHKGVGKLAKQVLRCSEAPCMPGVARGDNGNTGGRNPPG